jgi:HEAT repeat protein
VDAAEDGFWYEASHLSVGGASCEEIFRAGPQVNTSPEKLRPDADVAVVLLSAPVSTPALDLAIGPLHAAELTCAAYGFIDGDTPGDHRPWKVRAVPRAHGLIDASEIDFETGVVPHGMSGGPWVATAFDGTPVCIGISSMGGRGRSLAIVTLGGPIHDLLLRSVPGEVRVRHLLREQVDGYLRQVEASAVALPFFYPEALKHAAARGEPVFERIRQRVHVIDRATFEAWRRQQDDQERLRAAGQSAAFEAHLDPSTTRGEADGRETADAFDWDERADTASLRQVVVLGDPGFGKTWLLHHETRRLAARCRTLLDAAGPLTAPTDLPLPIYQQLPDLARHSAATLAERLDLRLEEEGRAPTLRATLVRSLEQRHGALLLDAWDEVSGGREALGGQIATFAKATGVRAVVASRGARYSDSPLPGRPELMLLPFERPEIEAFANIWFGPQGGAAAFLAALDASPASSGLARIPLLLAFLCETYPETQPSLPQRRGELYGRCLSRLLRDWPARNGRRDTDVDDSVIELRLRALAKTAEKLFPNEQFQTMQFAAAAAFPLDTELQIAAAQSYVEQLKVEGLIIPTSEDRQRWQFLHRTFHEYLTARAVGLRANEAGWDGVRAWVDAHAYDARWHEPIVLLAGELDDPVPLLRHLADPDKDDLFRPRLGLAARCVAEVTGAHRSRPAVESIVDDITTAGLDFYVDLSLRDIEPAAPFVADALPALAIANAHWGDAPMPARLARELVSADARTLTVVRDIAVRAPAAATPPLFEALLGAVLRGGDGSLIALGGIEHLARTAPAAAVRPLLDSVVRCLEHADIAVRMAGAEVAAALGSAAASSHVVVDALLRLLDDTDLHVRLEAVEAIGRLGAEAATEEVTGVLLRHWEDPEPRIQFELVTTLERLGPPAGVPEVLAALRTRMTTRGNDKLSERAAHVLGAFAGARRDTAILHEIVAEANAADPEQRSLALAALSSFGDASGDLTVLDTIVPLLFDEDAEVCEAAGSAIGDLGPPAATAPVLEALVALLDDDGADVRRIGVRALRDLSPASASDGVVRTLISLLRHHDVALRKTAVDVLEHLGAAAANDSMRDALLASMTSPDPEIRQTALRAIAHLGAAAATPPMIDALIDLLLEAAGRYDEDEEVLAAAALERFGATAATARVRHVLRARLIRAWPFAQSRLARALGKLGPDAAEPPIVRTLISLVESNEVPLDATKALGNIGPRAATPQVIDLLVSSLTGSEPAMQAAAAETFGQLGPRAARPDVLAALAAALKNDGIVWSIVHALEGLSIGNDDRVIDTLVAALNHEAWIVRRDVGRILGSIQRRGGRVRVTRPGGPAM